MMFTVRASQPPAEIQGGDVTNFGPNVVYYRDEAPVTSAVNDGTITVGDTATVAGTQYLTAANDFPDQGATVAVEPTPTVADGDAGVVTFEMLDAALLAILVVGRVHDGANYPERVEGVAFNHWVGPSEPPDFEDGDIWTPSV